MYFACMMPAPYTALESSRRSSRPSIFDKRSSVASEAPRKFFSTRKRSFTPRLPALSSASMTFVRRELPSSTA